MNPFDMLKNLKNVQAKMAEMQAKMETIFVTGTAGGGMASVTLNGKMEMISVEVSPEVFKEDDRVMLQDLVRAAYNDAAVKLKERLREELSSVTGGMGLPGMNIPGMDFPPGMFGT